jgi:flagellar biosynthetic protein FlhB
MSKKDDKTEDPTPKRKKDARKKGQVALSQDLAPWITILVGTYVLPAIISAVRGTVTSSLHSIERDANLSDPATALRVFGSVAQSTLIAIVPLLAVIAGTGAVAHLAQTGGSFSFHPLKPDFKRINPVAGIKRLFSPKKIWTTIQQVAKAAIIVFVVWPRAQAIVMTLTSNMGESILSSVTRTAGDVLQIIRSVCWTVLALAFVDYAVQRRRHKTDLKMSKQEVKDEMRHSEGDPHTKGRMRQLASGMSRKRMMTDVPTANVIVTNPTHIAVALRYDVTKSPAPQVVAIGTGSQAAKIRKIAGEAGVPVVEAKPLARALWRSCQVGDSVPVQLYEAVARVLVFVRRLKGGLGLGTTIELPSAYRTDESVLEAVQRDRRRRRR